MTGTTAGFGDVLPTPGHVRRIGRYELRGEIARGGMGVVYRAFDPTIQRAVAIKVMLALTNELRRRFDREANALARVTHPNVVQLLDYSVTPNGMPYLVMELVEGESLGARLREGPLAVAEALALTRILAEAVGACHRAGVLHRDLKPDNVLLAADGQPKLTDFGLVRDTDPSQSRTQLSVQGKFLGSPGYWAPEQAVGRLDAIGVRTDVYGLGATLFALLTGQPPHSGQSLGDILGAVREPKRAPSSLNPGVPRWLDKVVGKALATEPGDRFASADELGAALERAGPEPQPPRRPLPGLASVGFVIVGLLAARAVLSRAERSSAPAEAPGAALSPSVWAAGADGPVGGAADLQEAIRLASSGDAIAWVERSDERAKLGDFQGAIADAEEAIRLDPSLASGWFMRGSAKERLGDFRGAIADLDEAIRLDASSAQAWFNRGTAKSWFDLEGAIADFDAAIHRDPRYVVAWVNRGGAKAGLGDLEGAIVDLDEAIRLDPGCGLALLNRGFAKRDLGDLGGAVADLERALQSEPDANWVPHVREKLATARASLAEQAD